MTIIPGELTPILQPLNVLIIKLFKDHLLEEWGKWLASGEGAVTKAGNFRRLSLEKVAEWVMTAWNKIYIEIIKKSFKKYGISNALDGTEDGMLWQEPESQELEERGIDDEESIDDPHDNILTNEQMRQLFEESDEEDLYGLNKL